MGTRGARRGAPTPERRSDGRTGRPGGARKGHGATLSVLLMTLGALVGVGLLVAQAARATPTIVAAPPVANATHPATSATNPAAAPDALPADSGSGARVVYSISAARAWLVDAAGATEQTFRVVPGTVTPPAGTFHVNRKTSGATGSDGTSVEYIVYFDNSATADDAHGFAFDAVANVTGLPPASTGRTGGIRMAQDDAQEVWDFASVGTTVVVLS
jgi:lipoprotein-anchoring transpeptidase ErfK/SrfK